MDPADTAFPLSLLADASGATPRTIRYYIAQGLLPAPFGGGPATRYSQGHLDRLRLIRSLQRQHLPLAEIRARLEGLSDADVAALLAREPETPRPPESAIDYIRGLLSPIQAMPAPARAPAPPPSPLRASPRPALIPAPGPPPAGGGVLESVASYGQSARAAEGVSGPPQPNRSQWERLALDPDIELHVRRPLSRQQNRAVERLVAFARKVLEEEPS